MFDKFGEFDSFSEINELAENLLNEGDIESLKVVAKENGIQYIKDQIAIHHIINELYLCWSIILFAYFLHWMFPLLGVFSAICLPFVTAASVFVICTVIH